MKNWFNNLEEFKNKFESSIEDEHNTITNYDHIAWTPEYTIKFNAKIKYSNQLSQNVWTCIYKKIERETSISEIEPFILLKYSKAYVKKENIVAIKEDNVLESWYILLSNGEKIWLEACEQYDLIKLISDEMLTKENEDFEKNWERSVSRGLF